MTDGLVQALSNKTFIFIAGVEGSGTTIVLKLLSQVDHAIALGGNYFTPGYENPSKQLNALTQQLWHYPHELALPAKRALIEEIRSIELVKDIQSIVYKRSYPFSNPNYYPDLRDVLAFSDNRKFIIMRRDIRDNARSMLRRGFESSFDKALVRAKNAEALLAQQLASMDSQCYIELQYEALISSSKNEELKRLEQFLSFAPDLLVAHNTMITGPTSAREK